VKGVNPLGDYSPCGFLRIEGRRERREFLFFYFCPQHRRKFMEVKNESGIHKVKRL
jgi:hypothetical protein